MSVQLLSPFQIIIPSTYVCSCVRCVCDERGREGGGSHFRSPLSKSNLLILSRRGSSTNNERPGNRPSSTKIQH